MRSMMSAVTGLAVMLGLAFVSNSAFAQTTTHTTPFGLAAVEAYMGFRTTTWLEGHVVVWKRKSDGQCQVSYMQNGHNVVNGSASSDLMKVIVAPETIACTGAQSISLGPFTPSTIELTVDGRAGHDTMLLGRPALSAYGGTGNDLIVVVDNWGVQVAAGDGNDQLEAWGPDAQALLFAGAGDDCVWHPNVWELIIYPSALCEGGSDKSNFDGVSDCEQRMKCCPFGAFMGVCTP